MEATTTKRITQDRISQLAETINDRLRQSVHAIEEVNEDIHVLSINAKIQAARAGDAGRGFAVVADKVRGMVTRTSDITEKLTESVNSTVGELMEINGYLGTRVRGERLSQVAGTMIDIVDRNLYERSCDVRWWATDDSVVNALAHPQEENRAWACKRLGVILDSYTVYIDLILCDLQGRVVANGRPGQYASQGALVGNTEWFQSAVQTRSGADFGFQGLHSSPLVSGQNVMVYSCAVRRGGKADGELLGVLGIHFAWDKLGIKVVEQAEAMLACETVHALHAHLFYPDGTIIASKDGRSLLKKMDPKTLKEIADQDRGYLIPQESDRKDMVAGFARSQGFETYQTGWLAIVQEESD